MPSKPTLSAVSRGSQHENSSRKIEEGNGSLHLDGFPLEGRSTDEVLGLTEHGTLTKGIAWASLITMVLMAILTAGPYLMGAAPRKKKHGKPAAAAAQAKPAATPEAAANPDADTAEDAESTKSSKPELSEKAVKKLGVSEVKESDPKRNPLEDSVEDLLKSIK